MSYTCALIYNTYIKFLNQGESDEKLRRTVELALIDELKVVDENH